MTRVPVVTDLLSAVCGEVYISCRRQQAGLLDRRQRRIFDAIPDQGPAGGILSAFRFAPQRAWLVLACDLPRVTPESVRFLLEHRDPSVAATVYVHPVDRRLQPLFAVWEVRALESLAARAARGNLSPRRTLEGLDCRLLPAADADVLTNVNSPQECERLTL